MAVRGPRVDALLAELEHAAALAGVLREDGLVILDLPTGGHHVAAARTADSSDRDVAAAAAAAPAGRFRRDQHSLDGHDRPVVAAARPASIPEVDLRGLHCRGRRAV